MPLHFPNQIRFPIGGERVTCLGSNPTDFLGRRKPIIETTRNSERLGETKLFFLGLIIACFVFSCHIVYLDISSKARKDEEQHVQRKRERKRVTNLVSKLRLFTCALSDMTRIVIL